MSLRRYYHHRKEEEKRRFSCKLATSIIQVLDSSVSIIACFEALCGVRLVAQLLQIVPTLCKADDAKYIDDSCDWSCAKHWEQWWTLSVIT